MKKQNGIFLSICISMLSLFAFVDQTPLAQPSPDTTRSADSTKAISSTAQFMASYDPKVLEEIQKSPRSHFVDPTTSVVHLDSIAFARLSTPTAVVWLQLKLESYFTVKEARVVYCSEPGKGLERLALDAVKKGEFHPIDEHENWRWLYHQVAFTVDTPRAAEETDSLPRPDEYVPIEVEPQLTGYVDPEYPKQAKIAGITGLVWVKALLDKRGIVRQAMVLKTSGVPSLDSAAVRAAWGNRYKPAMVGGKPVAVWVSYKVEFKLD